MAIDTIGDLVGVRPIGFSGGFVDVYIQPIASNTQPAYSIAIPRSCAEWRCGRAQDVAFDRAGNLFVAADGYNEYCGLRGCYIRHYGRLIGFAAPLSPSGIPRFTTNAYAGPLVGIAVDKSGIVWAVLANNLPGNLIAYPPPYDGNHSYEVPANAMGGIAFDPSGNMYVAATDGIDVYMPPFSSSMTKAYTIAVTSPEHLAFDAVGNLYVTSRQSSGVANLLEFAPPYSGSSTPIVTMSPPDGAVGIAIAP
jgi:hypothetical protein